MSDERPASLHGHAELQRLLRGLGAAEAGQQLEPSTLPAHTPADELSREARMAARIDQQVAELTARRRSSRRVGLAVLAAAAVVLALGGMRHLRWDSGQLTIEQEPPAVGKPQEQAPPPSAAQPEQPAVAPPRVVAPSGRAPSVTESGPKAAPSIASVEAGSTLAQENQLFRESAEASRTGDAAGALARLDQLLTRYPASPLAQGALVRKFRLLASAGRLEEARSEAERYLAAYPTGFAVAEAEALKQGEGASKPPPSPGESETP
jgi:hypothetical protein